MLTAFRADGNKLDAALILFIFEDLEEIVNICKIQERVPEYLQKMKTLRMTFFLIRVLL